MPILPEKRTPVPKPKPANRIASLLTDDEDVEMDEVVREVIEQFRTKTVERIRVDVPDFDSDRGRTEAANALRLVDRYNDLLRYAVEWKDWLVWDGARWRRDVGGLGIQEKAAAVAACLWGEVADGAKLHPQTKRQMAAFATASNSAKGIAAMISLAKGKVPIHVERLDANPWLLNCANGTVELESGKLRSARQIDYLTKLCPTEYDRDADCPRWERFLAEVFAGDSELIAYVQRLLGYGLTGDVREQLLPVLWGEGSNGKSTLVNAVMNAVGDDYGGSPPRELFTVQKFGTPHPTNLMTLQGKRLMVAQETEAGAQLNEALIKHLTGGDKVTARGMYQDFSSFDPTHKLLLCTNHKPQVRGTDYAVWRRLKLVEFRVRFSGAGVDRTLPERLKAEAPGILAWMVRGCLDWREGGMREPESVAIATKAYASEMDEVGRFLDECCEVGPAFSAVASDLYRSFKNAMPDSEMTQTAFGREMSERGFAPGQVTSGPAKGMKTRKGLRLKVSGSG